MRVRRQRGPGFASCLGIGLLIGGAVSCGSDRSAEKVDAGQRRYCDARSFDSAAGVDAGSQIDSAAPPDVATVGARAEVGTGPVGDTAAVDARAEVGTGPVDLGTTVGFGSIGGPDGSGDQSDAPGEIPVTIEVPPISGPDARDSSDAADALRDSAADKPDSPPDSPADLPADTEFSDASPDSPADKPDAPSDGPVDLPADVVEAPEVAPDALDGLGDLGGDDARDAQPEAPDGPSADVPPAGPCLLNAAPWAKDWPEGVNVGWKALATGRDGTLWMGGMFFRDVDFGSASLEFSGPGGAQSKSDAFLVKLDPPTGIVSEGFGFGDKNNSLQRVELVAVAKNGNIAVVGSFTGEIDFTDKDSEMGEEGRGTDFLTATSSTQFYAVFPAASTGAYATPIRARLADIGFGTNGAALSSLVSHPDQNAFYLCGHASKAVPAWADSPTNKGLITGAAGTYGGGSDFVVAKIDAESGKVVWGKQFGAEGRQECLALAVDGNGDVFVAGVNASNSQLGTATIDFGGATTALSGTTNGQIVVAKLSGTDGSALLAKTWGPGSSSTENLSLSVDGANNVYLGGSTKSTVDFGDGLTLVPSTNQDFRAFIAKLTNDLVPLWGHIYGTDTEFIGDGGVAIRAVAPQYLNALATASTGDVLFVGQYRGGLGDLGVPQNPSLTSFDGFAAQLSSEGAVVCAQGYGGEGERQIAGLAVARAATGDLKDMVVAGGRFTSSIQIGATTLTSEDATDIQPFVCRLGPQP